MDIATGNREVIASNKGSFQAARISRHIDTTSIVFPELRYRLTVSVSKMGLHESAGRLDPPSLRRSKWKRRSGTTAVGCPCEKGGKE